MFRTFTAESLGTQQVAKSSVARQIREELQSSFPNLDLETLVPKKANLQLTKGRGEQNHIKLLGVDGMILFFQDRDGPWLPSLKTVERFPDIMPAFTCDKGGKDFVLRGAKVMAPGLTSAGGAVVAGVEKNKPVQILLEGEKGPQAVGMTLMSSEEILRDKKGVAVDNIHFRGDGLFTLLLQGALTVTVATRTSSARVELETRIQKIIETIKSAVPTLHTGGGGGGSGGVEGLPVVAANEVEFYVEFSPGRYKFQEAVRSETKVVGNLPFRVLVFPAGNQSESTLAAYVECAAEEAQEALVASDARWTWTGVRFQMMQINFKDVSRRSIVRSDSVSFSRTIRDRGWHDFAPVSELSVPSNGWLDEQNRLLFRAAVCVKQADQLAVSLDADTRAEFGAVGIRNHGATCYLNGLLQAMFHVGAIRSLVYRAAAEELPPAATAPAPAVSGVSSSSRPGTAPGGGSLIGALARTFENLQRASEPVDTKELIRSFGWDSLDAFTQQDAQELQRVLLDKLEEKLKAGSSQGSSQGGHGGRDLELRRLVEGKIENFIECVDVEYRSRREEAFSDIPLSLRNERNEKIGNLEQALEEFCAVELLEGENAYMAEGHGRVRARKGIRFLEFPPVLHFQLKRFHFDLERLELVKLHDEFKFPETLCLDKFCPGAGNFRLHSVLVHSGDINSGHYYAFVVRKTGASDARGDWLKLDDESVARASRYAAVEDNFGGADLFPLNYLQGGPQNRPRPRQHSAYMLVYVRESEMASILAEPEISACPNAVVASTGKTWRVDVSEIGGEEISVEIEKTTTMAELETLVKKKFGASDAEAGQAALAMWVGRRTATQENTAAGIFGIGKTYEYMNGNSDDVSCYLFGDEHESIVFARLEKFPDAAGVVSAPPTLVSLKRLDGEQLADLGLKAIFGTSEELLENFQHERVYSVTLLGVKEFDRKSAKFPTSFVTLVIGNGVPDFFARKKHQVTVTVRMRDVTRDSLLAILGESEIAGNFQVVAADGRWKMEQLAEKVREAFGLAEDLEISFFATLAGPPLIGNLSDYVVAGCELSVAAVATPKRKFLLRWFDGEMRETGARYVEEEFVASEASGRRVVLGQRGVILRHSESISDILRRFAPSTVEGVRLETAVEDERNAGTLTEVQQVDKNTGQTFGLAFLVRAKQGETAKDVKAKIAMKTGAIFPGRWRLMQNRTALKDEELVTPGALLVMEYLAAPGNFIAGSKPLTIR